MKPFDPNSFAHTLTDSHRLFVQSVNNVLNNNVDMGTPQGNTPVDTETYGINAGVYSKFTQGNGSGILIRIAANGIDGTGAPYNWGAPATGIVINHGLQRQPIGFHVVDQDKTVSVYRTAVPDQNQITLASSDNSASVTIYVF